MNKVNLKGPLLEAFVEAILNIALNSLNIVAV
jgi:hypothetical protein